MIDKSKPNNLKTSNSLIWGHEHPNQISVQSVWHLSRHMNQKQQMQFHGGPRLNWFHWESWMEWVTLNGMEWVMGNPSRGFWNKIIISDLVVSHWKTIWKAIQFPQQGNSLLHNQCNSKYMAEGAFAQHHHIDIYIGTGSNDEMPEN